MSLSGVAGPLGIDELDSNHATYRVGLRIRRDVTFADHDTDTAGTAQHRDHGVQALGRRLRIRDDARETGRCDRLGGRRPVHRARSSHPNARR